MTIAPPRRPLVLLVIWRNWCRSQALLPLKLRVSLRGERRAINVTDMNGIPIPSCVSASSPSTLSIWPLELSETSAGEPAIPRMYAATDNPLDVLSSYYNAIDRRDYARAYSYLYVAGSANKQTLPDFIAGYADTIAVRIETIAPANYLQGSNFHALTCVGIQLVAEHTNGQTSFYGGWYLVTSTAGQNPSFAGWRIVVHGSHIQPNGSATVPPMEQCHT